MTQPKPSDVAHRALHAVRHNDPLANSLREVDECMTDFLGKNWRRHLTPEDAITLTDITLNNVMEET